MPTSTTSAEYVVRLPLPEILLAAYEKDAECAGKSLEEFLANHLRRTRLLAGQQKPLIITDANRQRIETALARNFNDGAQLADSCEKLTALAVGGISINLSEQAMSRLSSRCYNETLAEFIQQTITRLVEAEVGLR